MTILFYAAAIIIAFIIIACAIIFLTIAAEYSKKGRARNTKSDGKHISDEQICSKCKIGNYNYRLDPKSEFCPNISSLDNGYCPFYKPDLSENDIEKV